MGSWIPRVHCLFLFTGGQRSVTAQGAMWRIPATNVGTVGKIRVSDRGSAGEAEKGRWLILRSLTVMTEAARIRVVSMSSVEQSYGFQDLSVDGDRECFPYSPD